MQSLKNVTFKGLIRRILSGVKKNICYGPGTIAVKLLTNCQNYKSFEG